MNDFYKKMVAGEDQPEHMSKLLSHCKELLRISRSHMSEHYPKWDRAVDTYRGIIAPNEDDHEAREHDEPERMIVPMNFAQVQSFAAFQFMTMTQSDHYMQYRPTGDEDFVLREVVELIMDRDFNHNKWPSVLYQDLVNIARLGIGIIKCDWQVVKKSMIIEGMDMPIDTEMAETAQGVMMPVQTPDVGATTGPMEYTLFEGNRVQTQTPYRFFPDTRLPLDRFQEGEFCASEEVFTRGQLEAWERQGLVGGIEHVGSMTKKALDKRSPSTRLNLEPRISRSGTLDSHVIVTEMFIDLNMQEYKLGPHDSTIRFSVWIANDSRIIRIAPFSAYHCQFPYTLGQLYPDSQQLIGDSLSDTIDALQDIVTWFINSRVMSVRRTIENQLVVDPAGIDVATLTARSPIIYTKHGMSHVGVDKYIKQLDVRDVTAGHIGDADSMMKILQVITGINDNATGQYASGRRSATESRAVQAGAAARLKMAGMVLSSQHYQPLGRLMLKNSRQSLTTETFNKIVGQRPLRDIEYMLYRADPATLIGAEDFFVLDTTLESEKGYVAQSLQELFIAMMSNPMIFQVAGYDPKAMLDEIYTLRGVKNLTRFNQQNANQQPGMAPGGLPQQPNAQGPQVAPSPM